LEEQPNFENEFEENFWSVFARNPYFEKRNGPGKRFYLPDLKLVKKPNSINALGSGKKDTYNFGLGKRTLKYSLGLEKVDF